MCDVGLLSGIAVGADSFEVTPGPASVYSALILLGVIIGGGVTMAKGRWGWLVVGLLTFGLIWLVSALLPPRAGSLWERRLGHRPAQ